MKRYLAALAVLLVAFPLLGLSCTPPATGSARTMIWEDNFDGTTLDANNWRTGWFGDTLSGPVGEDEEACYSADQVAVGVGALWLTIVDPPGETYCPKTASDPNPYRHYLSGMVSSRGKAAFHPVAGHELEVEARIQLDCVGDDFANWPAFWMLDEVTGATGELDIMEGLDGEAEATWHGPSSPSGGNKFGFYNIACVPGAWHTYSAVWTTDSVTSYLDGTQVGSYTSASNVTETDQYLILGLQASSDAGEWGGPVKVPSTMYVDWVRVYQRA